MLFVTGSVLFIPHVLHSGIFFCKVCMRQEDRKRGDACDCAEGYIKEIAE